MWRRLLSKYFPRVSSTGRNWPRRHLWLVEPFEQRVLLSADLLPADDVLHIVGTEGNDSALIRTLKSDTGGTAQLFLTLNGLSSEYTIRTGQAIQIDLLDGNDTLAAQLTVDADWNIILGDGDDQTRVETQVGDESDFYRVRVDAGDGDNETTIQFGDGPTGRVPPTGQTHITAEYRSGVGNDRLTFDWLVHLNRLIDVDFAAITGAGNDDVVVGWEHHYEFRPGKFAETDYKFELGDGDDTLTCDFLGDLDAIRVTADAGAGNDKVRSNVFATWLTTGFINVDAGKGDDLIDICAVVRAENLADLSLGLTADAGEGNDKVHVSWADNIPMVDLDLTARVGQVASFLPEKGDEVLIAFEHGDIAAPVVVGMLWNGADRPPETADDSPTREFRLEAGSSERGAQAIKVTMRLGDQKDELGLRFAGELVDTVETAIDMDLNLGAGANTLRVDAFGGVDPAVSLEDLVFNAHIQSLGTLALLAIFPLGVVEMSQAIAADRMGQSSASLDLLLDAADLTADVRTAAADDTLTITPARQSLRATSARLEFVGGDGTDAVSLDMGDLDAPVIGSFSEVSGLTSETTVVEYQAGVDIGDNFSLAIDLASLESLSMKTGNGEDAIRVELDHPQAPVPELAVYTGGGNDTVVASFIGVLGDVALNLDTGTGDDTVDVNVTESASIVTGPGRGLGPHVKAFSGATATETQSFFAYDAAFTGGVRVAAGDINGDGVADIITGTGPGAGPHVKVFDGRSGAQIRSFFAYVPTFTGGVFVAAGDINGDGRDDIITGADAGAGPHVKVFDGRTGTEIRSFSAYAPTFAGGVRVAAGDVNGDGNADIITSAGGGAGPLVKVFDGRTGAEIRSFFAYDPAFTGGVFVASGDINGDNIADIVTGMDAGGTPHVKVFDGSRLAVLHSFFAYAPTFTGGVRVAAGDINGDGHDDIITGAGPGASPHVKAFDGVSGGMLRSFFPYDPNFRGGVYVAAVDVGSGDPGAFDLTLDTAAGDDRVDLVFITGGPRSDFIDADMGTGADTFVLNWKGALQDPAVPQQINVQVDLGAADLGQSGPDDVVRVTFVDGDPDRPLIIGFVWNSNDSVTPDSKSLRAEITSTNGILGSTNLIAGGSRTDSMQLYFQGRLKVAGQTQMHSLFDMGAGDDQVLLDFANLDTEGAGKESPIAVDVRGAGVDALEVTGTDGDDLLTVTENAVMLDGIANIGYAGFELLRVNALAGDDTVTMTGINPVTRTTLDGGMGRDRFVGRFDSDVFGNLTLVNFEQTKMQGRGRLIGTLTEDEAESGIGAEPPRG